MKGHKGDRQSLGGGGVYVTIIICGLCVEINKHLVTYALLLPCYPKYCAWIGWYAHGYVKKLIRKSLPC